MCPSSQVASWSSEVVPSSNEPTRNVTRSDRHCRPIFWQGGAHIGSGFVIGSAVGAAAIGSGGHRGMAVAALAQGLIAAALALPLLGRPRVNA